MEEHFIIKGKSLGEVAKRGVDLVRLEKKRKNRDQLLPTSKKRPKSAEREELDYLLRRGGKRPSSI